MIGSIVLAVSLWLPWFRVAANFPLAGREGPADLNAWQTFPAVDIVLLVCAAAPFILTWIVVAGVAVSWPRGEITAMLGLVAMAVTVYFGLMDPPGEGGVSMHWGWYLGLVGSILVFVGGAWRTAERPRRRRPPGTF